MRGDRLGRATRIALLLGFVASAGRSEPARTPAASTPRFTFFVDFETNLNDALVNAGVDRKFRRPALFETGADAACFAHLEAAARDGWERALAGYAATISPGEWSGREQMAIRLDLAGRAARNDDEGRRIAANARELRRAAAPAFRACRWTDQEAEDRRWIDSLRGRLAAHETALAERLEKVYATHWSSLPLEVDVVRTVNWAGANTIFLDGGGGHLLVATENPDETALEVIFHEASHLLMGRDAPIRRALQRAADAAGYRLPGDLWHAVLFATTGEIVRQRLAESGEPPYRPMMEGMYAKGSWGAERAPLTAAWLPYVRGERSLEDASSALVAALRTAGADAPVKP